MVWIDNKLNEQSKALELEQLNKRIANLFYRIEGDRKRGKLGLKDWEYKRNSETNGFDLVPLDVAYEDALPVKLYGSPLEQLSFLEKFFEQKDELVFALDELVSLYREKDALHGEEVGETTLPEFFGELKVFLEQSFSGLEKRLIALEKKTEVQQSEESEEQEQTKTVEQEDSGGQVRFIGPDE